MKERKLEKLRIIGSLLVAILLCFPCKVNFCGETQQKEKSLVSVESYVDRATITIGDRILYTLMVTTDPEIKLEPLALGSNLGAFEVKDYKISDPEKTKDGKVINKSEYIITTGASESDKEDIRGLKPPIQIRGGYWAYLLILPILVLLGTGGFLYYRQRAKGLALPGIPEELQKPAWEVALFELESLRNSDFLKKKQIKKYFTFLSDIIRKYLERRYEISALDRTTEEIRGEIKRAKLEQGIAELIYGLLFFSDLVKFAKYVPSNEEIEKGLNHAYDIVNMTKQAEVKEEVAVVK